MISWLRWHVARAKFPFQKIDAVPRASMTIQRHDKALDDLKPDTPEYGRLAARWGDIARSNYPPYAFFLKALERRFRTRIHSVLDLACGCGVHARMLAASGKDVTGLDRSEAMLEQARWHSANGIRFRQGDFRDFALGETFDAVLCAGDSLNYVNSQSELAAVMRCVAAHLKSGGLFLFDVLDEQAFVAGINRHNTIHLERGVVEMVFFYDAVAKVGEARVIVDGAVERHRRIPLEEADVRAAASSAGLKFADRFSHNTYLGTITPARQFYILRQA